MAEGRPDEAAPWFAQALAGAPAESRAVMARQLASSRLAHLAAA